MRSAAPNDDEDEECLPSWRRPREALEVVVSMKLRSRHPSLGVLIIKPTCSQQAALAASSARVPPALCSEPLASPPRSPAGQFLVFVRPCGLLAHGHISRAKAMKAYHCWHRWGFLVGKHFANRATLERRRRLATKHVTPTCCRCQENRFTLQNPPPHGSLLGHVACTRQSRSACP